MSTMWGELELNVDESDYTPPDKNLAEKDVVSLPPEYNVVDEHSILIAENITNLDYRPGINNVKSIKSVVVTGPNNTPIYKENTDYVIDYTNGTIHRVASGAIPDFMDCYIDYVVTFDMYSTIIMGGIGRKRRQITLECWANYEEYYSLETDYYNNISKILLIETGKSFTARIFKISKTTRKQGLDRLFFTIVFIEA